MAVLMTQAPSKILVVDLEATCADDGSLPPQAMEIIEIGAVWATSDGAILDRFQTFVLPLQRPALTPFCIGLTGIRQADLDAAPLLPVAARALGEFANLRREPGSVWASWGAYDRKQFERDFARHSIEDPLRLPHENLSRLFAKRQQIDREIALSDACKLANVTLEGVYHRALDDAINTAHLLPWIWGIQSRGANLLAIPSAN
jgi:inhibitor of KinA sporulation pathway (predicted exonuclease)